MSPGEDTLPETTKMVFLCHELKPGYQYEFIRRITPISFHPAGMLSGLDLSLRHSA